MPHDSPLLPISSNRLIRLGTTDDVPALIALDTYATRHVSRCDFIYDAVVRQQCLVAVAADHCAGYLILTHAFFNHGFVELVVVSPTQQRQGIALGLLAAAEAACKTAKLFVSTNASNTASQALFKKAGFVPSGQIDNLDEHDPERVYVKFVR